MRKRDIKSSLSVGTRGEDAVSKVLTSAGFTVRKNPDTSKAGRIGWDLEADGPRKFTVEVKLDLYSARSGNLALEYWNVKSGTPSGISATTADLWAFVLPCGQVWVCRVGALKAYVAATPPLRDIACGGDDNASMKLYRKADILPAVFTRLDELNPVLLRAAISRLLGQ